MSNLFIFGAGFDRAIGGDSLPLNSELLAIMRKRVISSEWDRHFAKSPTNDIEVYLTRLDLDIVSEIDPVLKRELRSLRDWIGQNLADFFRSNRFNSKLIEDKAWPKILSTAVLRPNDAAVNLNYSTLLESMLDFFGIWSPRGGYSESLSHPLLAGSPTPDNKTLRNIVIYKIHGSENFRRSEILGTAGNISIDCEIDSAIFGNSCAATHFGTAADRGAYIIAPSFIKALHPEINSLFLEAIEWTKSASNIVIIGCGVRPEDSHLGLLFANFLRRPIGTIGKFVIVDPNAKLVGERLDSSLEGVPARFDKLICIEKPVSEAMPELIAALGGTNQP